MESSRARGRRPLGPRAAWRALLDADQQMFEARRSGSGVEERLAVARSHEALDQFMEALEWAEMGVRRWHG